MVTMIREAIDDIRRYKRDREVNSKKYQRLTPRGPETIPSSNIHVGDIILVEKVGWLQKWFLCLKGQGMIMWQIQLSWQWIV